MDINGRITALANYRVLTDVRPDTSIGIVNELKSLGEQLSSLQDYVPEEEERAPTISNRAETQQGIVGSNIGGGGVKAFGYVNNFYEHKGM